MVAKVIDKAQFLFVCGMLFFLPFVFSRNLMDGFESPREYFAKLGISLLLAFWGLRKLFFADRRELRFWPYPVTIYFIWAGLSLAWHFRPQCGLQEIADLSMWLLFLFFCAKHVSTAFRKKTVLWMLVLAAVGVTLFQVLQTRDVFFRVSLNSAEISRVSSAELGEIRANPEKARQSGVFFLPPLPELVAHEKAGTLGNVNYLASIQALTIPLSFTIVLCANFRLERIIAFLSMIFLLQGLVVTGCRAGLGGAFLGLAVVCLLWFSFRRRRPHRGFGWKAILLFVMIVSLSFLYFNQNAPRNLFDRILEVKNYTRDYSRFQAWRLAWRGITGSAGQFLAGAGIGGYKHVFPFWKKDFLTENEKISFYPGNVRQLHLDYLQAWVDLGLIGLTILFSGFLVFAIRSVLSAEIPSAPKEFDRHSSFFAQGLWGGLAAILGIALFDFPFCRPSTSVWFVAVLGMTPGWTEPEPEAEVEAEAGPGHGSGSGSGSGTEAEAEPGPEPETGPEAEPEPEPEPEREKSPAFRILPPKAAWGALLGVALCFGGLAGGFKTWREWRIDRLNAFVEGILQAQNRSALLLAQEALEEAIRIGIPSGVAPLQISYLFELNKDPDRAEEWANRAFEFLEFSRGEYSIRSYFYRLVHIAYHRRKDPLLTETRCREALKWFTNIDRSVYFYFLIHSLLDRNLPRQASECYLSFPFLLDEKAGYSYLKEISERLALTLASLGSWDAALKVAEQPLGYNFRTEILHDIAGISATFLGRHEQGEEFLRKGLEIASGSAVLWKDLGFNLSRQGRNASAAEALEKALSFNTLSPGDRAKVSALLEKLRILR